MDNYTKKYSHLSFRLEKENIEDNLISNRLEEISTKLNFSFNKTLKYLISKFPDNLLPIKKTNSIIKRRKIYDKREKYKWFYDGISLQCAKCEKIKPIDKFHKHKTKPHGLKPICKECDKLLYSKIRLEKFKKTV